MLNKLKQEANVEKYKEDFIDFLLEKDALKIGEFKLKSGRKSPYFVNMGELLKKGDSISRLGEFYAEAISTEIGFEEFDVIFGPADKGTPLSSSIASAIYQNHNETNKKVIYNRKVPKHHGEGTGGDIQKNWFFGAKLDGDERILIVDDVFTTGETKYDALELFRGISDKLQYTGILIGVDRQEIGEGGKSAIKEFTEKTRIPVYSIVTVSEIFEYLTTKKSVDMKGSIRSLLSRKDKKQFVKYLSEYGTDEAKNYLEINT